MKKCMFILRLVSMPGIAACESKTETNQVSNFSVDPVKAAITASNDVFGKMWAAGDSAAFGNSCTTDAHINFPNMERMTGRAAAMAFFSEGYAWGIRGGSLTTERNNGWP